MTPQSGVKQSNEIPSEEKSVTTFVQDKSYRTLWGYFKTPLIWRNIFAIAIMHLWALQPLYFYDKISLNIVIFHLITMHVATFGLTGGAHRLWTHRSYKATLPVRVFLSICYAMAGQYSLFRWVRDHRVHHKFSETDADPHNSKRGFFFAHIGWFMMKRHPEVTRKGSQIDLSDLWEDPVFVFMDKYYVPMTAFWCFIFPTLVPCLLWNEPLYWSFTFNISRLVLGLNLLWLINSAAHIYGNRPFNAKIGPTDNKFIAIWSLGEAWHNYHHTFPLDYRASDYGIRAMNLTAVVLDVFSYFGMVYDLKTTSPEVIQKYIDQYGDGTYKQEKLQENKLSAILNKVEQIKYC